MGRRSTAAIWGVLDDGGVTPESLRRMGTALSQGGRGEPGIILGDGIGLGRVLRLPRGSTDDGAEKSRAASPLSESIPGSGGGARLVVADAVIDNRRALRTALAERGHRFRTQDDSEVILRGYSEWGDDVVHHLQGPFAFAMWDGARRRLLLARDRFGEKPLYFRWQDGRRFQFASSPRALFAVDGGRPEIDSAALHLYLALDYVPSPWSLFQGVRKLGAGERLVVEAGAFRTERFWSFSTAPKTTLSVREAKDELVRRFDAALSRQLEGGGDDGVGVFLSGGIDSALVASSSALLGHRPPLFSVGFDEAGYDEIAKARHVAKFLGLPLHVASLDANTAWNLHGQAAEVFDEPVADPAVLPTLLLAQVASHRVGTVLTGDGADELFGGYDTFVAARIDEVTRWLDGVKRPGAALAARLWPERGGHFSTAFRLRQFASGLSWPPSARAIAWMLSRTPEELRELTGNDEASAPIDGLLASLPSSGNAVDDVSVTLIRLYLEGNLLPKTQRSGASVGLEIRSPFLDPSLASFAGSLPPSWKLGLRTRKWMLRRAFAHRLGAAAGRPKRGLSVPVGEWMRGKLKGNVEELLLDPAMYRLLSLERNEVRELIRVHLGGRRNLRKPLWNLVTLFRWADHWLAAPVPGHS